ncbi:MAG: hypothetical protein BWY06_00952 [Candidatus Latescibacteria bacterium ADurb.Bin168]|nr:MAG: hypothetical protein BWY06_00952 [Candidatus Latescibacteria bacterium ADurb.Bin168]
MAEPYTIHILVVDGDPGGVKIVDRQNWTGWGIAFPRSAWPSIAKRREFGSPGVYILTGVSEGAQDELPTVYVGQGDEIRTRIDTHYAEKDFWAWGYAFVSKGTALNRAHTTWLEHALIDLAHEAGQCHLDNNTRPKEPNLAEWERADTQGFLRKILRILPLIGVRVFERPTAVTMPTPAQPPQIADERDTVVVPAWEDGFKETFLGQDCWHTIRISGGMLQRIRFIAAYRTAPVSAITHYAPVERIEPYGDHGGYRLIFSAHAKEITPIPYGNAVPGTMQGPRYTSLKKLLAAKSVAELFGQGTTAQPI